MIPSRAAVMRLHRASQSAGWIARICPRARPSGLARPASAFVRAALCPRADERVARIADVLSEHVPTHAVARIVTN